MIEEPVYDLKSGEVVDENGDLAEMIDDGDIPDGQELRFDNAD